MFCAPLNHTRDELFWGLEKRKIKIEEAIKKQ